MFFSIFYTIILPLRNFVFHEIIQYPSFSLFIYFYFLSFCCQFYSIISSPVFLWHIPWPTLEELAICFHFFPWHFLNSYIKSYNPLSLSHSIYLSYTAYKWLLEMLSIFNTISFSPIHISPLFCDLILVYHMTHPKFALLYRCFTLQLAFIFSINLTITKYWSNRTSWHSPSTDPTAI